MKPPLTQIIQRLRMGGKVRPFCQLQIENQNVQLALCGNLGVQLPQRPGRSIPGIGKRRLPCLFPLHIEGFKHFFRHKHFAPDNEPFGRILQHHGDGANGLQILCHILPHPAVSSGGAPDKLAIQILQSHRQTVYLGLHRIHCLRCSFPHPGVKFPQLFHGKHIL